MFADPVKIVERIGLAPGMAVADLGAGSGAYTLAAARLIGDRGRVFAVEIQKDLLDLIKNSATRENMHNVEVVWGDIEHVGGTRLRDASLDRVIASNVLFQVSDREGFVKEAKRILKTGGKVLLVDWSDSTSVSGPDVRHVVRASDARALFESNGFQFGQELPAGAHHYALIFSRK